MAEPPPASAPDVVELLAAYNGQLRTRVPARLEPEVRMEWDGPLLRVVGWKSGGFIMYRDVGGLVGPELDHLIARQVRFFGERNERFEWKLHGHDRPSDLAERLRQAGFVPEELETVVIAPSAEIAAQPRLPQGVSLREVTARADFDRIAAFEDAVWDDPHAWLAESLELELATYPNGLAVVVAEHEGAILCAGWVRFVEGTDFATFWGGATLPAWRRHGIYRSHGPLPREPRRSRRIPLSRGRRLLRQPSDPRAPRLRCSYDDDAVHLVAAALLTLRARSMERLGAGTSSCVPGSALADRTVEPEECLSFQRRYPLVVPVNGQRAADEEGEDPSAEQLVVGDRPVGLAKLHAPVRREGAPVEDEVDAGIVVAEIDPVDHGRSAPPLVDEQMPEMKIAVNESRRLRRAEVARRIDHFVCFSRWVPEPELLQFGQPLARLRHPQGHVRPSERIERQLRVEHRGMERPKELAERPRERSAPVVVQSGLGQLTAGNERGAVERPAVVGRRLTEVCRDRDRQR